MTPTPTTVDRLVDFARDLRGAGLTIGVDQTQLLAGSLDWIDSQSRPQVRNAARATLVSRCEDLPLFEDLFERFWPGPERSSKSPRKAPPAPRYDPEARMQPALVSFMAEQAAAGAREVELGDRSSTWSADERIQKRDFVDMSAAELREVERFLSRMRWRTALRQTRRRVPDRRGDQLDLRRVLSQAARQGGQVLSLPRQSRKIKPRPLVLIADISGSMELYSRILMQFFHSVGRSLGGVESFVFGTRLTRITAQLESRNLDQALRQVSAEVIDWAGGTRIGDCLADFNRVWSRRVLRRGALVLIVSDGWDRGDVRRLESEMRFLHDRSHRLLWLNPLLGGAGYEPLVEGMRSALPYVDAFLPVHDLHSLSALAEHLSRIPRLRRGSLRGAGPYLEKAEIQKPETDNAKGTVDR